MLVKYYDSNSKFRLELPKGTWLLSLIKVVDC